MPLPVVRLETYGESESFEVRTSPRSVCSDRGMLPLPDIDFEQERPVREQDSNLTYRGFLSGECDTPPVS